MNEFQIFQNKILSAHLIWEFAKSYEDYNYNKAQPDIFYTLPVLPICLNARAVKTIKERRLREGSLLKVIDEQKDIFAGLQERMQNMAQHTLESIYLAVATNLIQFDKESLTIIPSKKNVPTKVLKSLGPDYLDLLSTSKRLGAWTANMNISELSLYFNITY